MRPCDQRSHPYICRSVPQMDAAVTRTRTSVGPIEGTGADSNDSPAPARILRKAFICPDLVTDIYRGSQVQRNFWMVAHYMMVAHWRELAAEPVAWRATSNILDYTLVTKRFKSDIGRAILSPL